MEQKIRIKIEGYDCNVVEHTVKEIVATTKRTGASISGPVFLPTKVHRVTVLRSPHVDKNSREQFEIKVHKRLVEIIDPLQRTTDELKNLIAPAGVEIKIKIITQ
ncbi:MAG: 30S ribosomal protein S10 [Planctomycetes bacterium]|nr:30S ribosomal protein S10 [Planctomycetota bacterium]